MILRKVFEWCAFYNVYQRQNSVKNINENDQDGILPKDMDEEFALEDFNVKYFNQLEQEGTTTTFFEIMMVYIFLYH